VGDPAHYGVWVTALADVPIGQVRISRAAARNGAHLSRALRSATYPPYG
jgi:hypothetical protein